MPRSYDATAVPERIAVPSAKAYREGTERTTSPAVTFGRVSANREAMGITRVGSVTGLDRIGIPVWFAVRPLSRNLSVSQGKGLTDDAAKTSALMESAEMWHAEQHRHTTVVASVDEMRSDPRTAPVDLLQRQGKPRISETDPIEWVETWDLISETTRLVPYESTHVDGRRGVRIGDGLFKQGSNGLASGNTFAEAVGHGICEVIERNAIAESLVNHYDRPKRRLDLATVDDPHCRELIRRLEAAGVEPVVWDLTGDLGLPVMDCGLIEKTEHGDNRYHPLPQMLGSGAHCNRSVALARALAEAAQGRATVIGGARDDIVRADFDYLFDPEVRSEAASLPEETPRSWDEVPTIDNDDHRDDIGWLCDRLRSTGYQSVLIIDHSEPGIDIPVAKAVIPGMRQAAE